jgi:glyoxylase-like metal-dependent hydrolase (beta-lactamase superfamily II)
MSSSALPPPAPNQTFCDVSVLEAGHLKFPSAFAINNAPRGETRFVPSLSFMLLHSSNGQKIDADLGLRKDAITALPPAIVAVLKKSDFTSDVPQDVVESLAMGGVKADEIDHVCLTHCHLDHFGDTKPFTKARFVVGGDTPLLIRPAEDPNSIYPSDLLPEDRTLYITPTGSGPDAHKWSSIGPFPHAYDYLGDGSVYIVNASGHCPGHVNVLARTNSDGD